MSNKSYSQEFKEEALKQIRDRGYSVLEVFKRLGVSILNAITDGAGAQGFSTICVKRDCALDISALSV